MLELLRLAALLLGPLVFSFLLVLSIFHRGQIGTDKLLATMRLSSDHGLVKQPLFWWSIAAPASYFAATGAICWSGHEVSITSEGFSTFIKISALPLGLLSLAIPLGVTIARFHSTEQTAKQISIATNQLSIAEHKNNVDAFYAHRKEFFAFFDRLGTVPFLDTLTVEYKINPRLHGLVFNGRPEKGAPELDAKLISDVVSRIKFVRKSLDLVLRDENPESTFTWYKSAADDIYWISRLLGIREINWELKSVSVVLTGFYKDGEAMRFRSLGTTTVQAIAAFRCVKSYILTILYFAGDEKSIDEIYNGELDHIDKTTGYLHVHAAGPVIERNFGGMPPTPWNVDSGPATA